MARYRELTYRTVPIDARLVGDMAQRLIDQPVVIWLVKRQVYKRGCLVSVDLKANRFQVKWSKHGAVRTYKGVWRVHNAKLFSDSVLPTPCFPARIPEVNNHYPGGVSMAARAARKTGAKASGAKASAKSNGGERTRSNDILEDFTEAERRKLAKAIIKMKKGGAKWGEIGEELDLPGERPSVAGRRLLREYSDDGEEFIRERVVATKAKAATKKRGRKAADEDDDDDDDDDEPAPRRAKRKVAVKRGSGKRSSPS